MPRKHYNPEEIIKLIRLLIQMYRDKFFPIEGQNQVAGMLFCVAFYRLVISIFLETQHHLQMRLPDHRE